MATEDDEFDISLRLEQAITNVSVADLGRIFRQAQYSLIGGTSYADGEELFNESILRTADGRRKWPPGEDFGAYIWMVMRSIADADRNLAQHRIEFLANDHQDSEAYEHEGDRLAMFGSNALAVDNVLEDAEFQRHVTNQLQSIEDYFKDDEDVTLVIMAIEDGIPPRDLEADYGMTLTKYESARKKLRRYIDRQFPGRRMG